MSLIFSFLVSVYFVQVCLSAPAGDAISSGPIDTEIEAAIEEVLSTLKRLPVIRISKSNNDLVEILKKFRQNTTESETVGVIWDLLSLALQGPVCGRKEIDLRQLLDTNSNESKGGGITVEKMREAQEKLSKVLKPEQTQRAMIILRGLRAEATQKEKQEAVLDLISSAKVALHIVCVDNDARRKRL